MDDELYEGVDQYGSTLSERPQRQWITNLRNQVRTNPVLNTIQNNIDEYRQSLDNSVFGWLLPSTDDPTSAITGPVGKVEGTAARVRKAYRKDRIPYGFRTNPGEHFELVSQAMELNQKLKDLGQKALKLEEAARQILVDGGKKIYLEARVSARKAQMLRDGKLSSDPKYAEKIDATVRRILQEEDQAAESALQAQQRHQDAVRAQDNAAMAKDERRRKRHSTYSNAGRHVAPANWIGLDNFNLNFQYHPGKGVESNFKTYLRAVQSDFPDKQFPTDELIKVFEKRHCPPEVIEKIKGSGFNYLNYIQ